MAAFVAVGAILFLGLPAVDGEFERTVRDGAVGGGATVVNETWTANTSNAVELTHSGKSGVVYNETVEVYDSTGAEVPDSEYRWYSHNGTLRDKPGGTLTDGETADVTYGWANATNSQQLAKDTADIPLTQSDGIAALVGLGVIVVGLMMIRRM